MELSESTVCGKLGYIIEDKEQNEQRYMRGICSGTVK
jgi:hypothetical protein